MLDPVIAQAASGLVLGFVLIAIGFPVTVGLLGIADVAHRAPFAHGAFLTVTLHGGAGWAAAVPAPEHPFPATDHPGAGSPCHAERGAGCGMAREGMAWFWNHDLPDHAARTQRHAAPGRAADLARLPPAPVITAGCDPLRDEGKVFADRHGDAKRGFISRVGLADRAEEARDEGCAWPSTKL